MFKYEYAVVRVVPRVDREEFMNVGVVLFCKQSRYIGMKYHFNPERLKCFSHSETDYDQIRANLEAFEKIAYGMKEGGRIALEEVPERFRWLTAVRSSVIQTSRPHPGMCLDLDVALERLMKDFVD